ncbi:MAG: hypothetical protein QM496_02630 [Verrucomicrobiota bacterium]
MMNIFTEWWGGLDLTLQIFYALGIFSGSILLMQTALMVLGIGDGALDMDTDFDLDHDGGGHILSVRSITGFLFAFGWTGALCLQSGLGIGLTILAAIAAGTAMLFLLFGLMRLINSLRQDGTINYRNAIDQIGTVYLPIPAGGQQAGKIEVVVQGRLSVMEAFHKGEHKLENGSKVKVVDVIGENGLLVEPLS